EPLVATLTPAAPMARGTAMVWLPLLTVMAAAAGPLSSESAPPAPGTSVYLKVGLSKVMEPTVLVPLMLTVLSAAGGLGPVPKVAAAAEALGTPTVQLPAVSHAP